MFPQIFKEKVYQLKRRLAVNFFDVAQRFFPVQIFPELYENLFGQLALFYVVGFHIKPLAEGVYSFWGEGGFEVLRIQFTGGCNF